MLQGRKVAAKWQDKRAVHFLSTADDAAETTQVKRKKKDGSCVKVDCLTVVDQYNKNMNGVDHADQLRNEYPTYRKSKKWWHSLFWFLVDISICNLFILMKESMFHQMKTKSGKAKPRTMLSFRMQLAKQLIGTYREPRKRTMSTNKDTNGNVHLLSKGKRGRCKECREVRGKTATPTTKCDACRP
jgi:hypothetical protein